MVVGLTLSQPILLLKGEGGLVWRWEAWLSRAKPGWLMTSTVCPAFITPSIEQPASGCKTAWKGVLNELTL